MTKVYYPLSQLTEDMIQNIPKYKEDNNGNWKKLQGLSFTGKPVYKRIRSRGRKDKGRNDKENRLKNNRDTRQTEEEIQARRKAKKERRKARLKARKEFTK